MRVLLLVALLLAGCASPADLPVPTPGPAPALDAWSWDPRAEAPIILAEAAVASEGSTMHVVGGWTEAGGGSPLALRYDGASDAWAQLPAYPLPIHHAQAAAIDGALYVFGGATTQALLPGTLVGAGPKGWPITALAFRLDPGATSWTPIAQLPVARGLGGAAVVDGKIYLVGGVTLGGAYVADVDVYDSATDSYADAPALPTTRDHLSVVAVNGTIYAIAGRSNANGTWDDVEANEALDVATGAWRALAPAPLARGGQGAGALADGRIVLVGGERAEGEFTVFDDVHAYDPAADAWTDLPRLPEARHGMVAGSLDGALFLAGGATLEGAILRSSLALTSQRESSKPDGSR